MATGIPDLDLREIRAKGGRASGGTRYFQGKRAGEDKMVRLMQQAIDEKHKESAQLSEENETVKKITELLAALERSKQLTEEILSKRRKKICSTKKNSNKK